MYIPPLMLLVPEFAADYTEENEQLLDTICLRKYEELSDVVNEIFGDGYGYCVYCEGYGYGHGGFSYDDIHFGSGDASGRGTITMSGYNHGFCAGYGFNGNYGYL